MNSEELQKAVKAVTDAVTVAVAARVAAAHEELHKLDVRIAALEKGYERHEH